jgi:aspartate kinase
MSELRVCKFGGTSVASAAQLRQVRSIIDAEPTRRIIVPSAPGKRTKEEAKITDLLYLAQELG